MPAQDPAFLTGEGPADLEGLYQAIFAQPGHAPALLCLDTQDDSVPPEEIDLFLATIKEVLDLALTRRPEDAVAEIRMGLERTRARLDARVKASAV